MQEQVKHDSKAVLDLSYYYLGNDGIIAIVPHLSDQYLLGIRELDISYNNVNDAGLDPLVQSMASAASPIEKFNLSGNPLSDYIIGILSDHIRMGKLKNLADVVLEECTKITPACLRNLQVAQLKAVKNKGDSRVNELMRAGKKRDQQELDGDVEFEDVE